MSVYMTIRPFVGEEYVVSLFRDIVCYIDRIRGDENIKLRITNFSGGVYENIDNLIHESIFGDVISEVLYSENKIEVSSIFNLSSDKYMHIGVDFYGSKYNSSYDQQWYGVISFYVSYSDMFSDPLGDNFIIPSDKENNLNMFENFIVDIVNICNNIVIYSDFSVIARYSGIMAPNTESLAVYYKDILSSIKDIDIAYGLYNRGIPPAFLLSKKLNAIDISENDLHGVKLWDPLPKDTLDWMARNDDYEALHFYQSLTEERVAICLNSDVQILRDIFRRAEQAVPEVRQLILPDGGILLSSRQIFGRLLPFYRYLYDELSARV